MCPISNQTRPISHGETSWNSGNAPSTPDGKNYYQDLIDQANMVPLTLIFKHYGMHLDPNCKKATCPFRDHKGGRETSASFVYYPETNSFFCYGCKLGGKFAHGSEFISFLEGINRFKAAQKVLSLFSQDVDIDNVYDDVNFSERLEVMLNFSKAVKNFRRNHSSEKSFEFIENYICKSYDKLNDQHKLDNSALARIVEELKTIMDNYHE